MLALTGLQWRDFLFKLPKCFNGVPPMPLISYSTRHSWMGNESKGSHKQNGRIKCIRNCLHSGRRTDVTSQRREAIGEVFLISATTDEKKQNLSLRYLYYFDFFQPIQSTIRLEYLHLCTCDMRYILLLDFYKKGETQSTYEKLNSNCVHTYVPCVISNISKMLSEWKAAR